MLVDVVAALDLLCSLRAKRSVPWDQKKNSGGSDTYVHSSHEKDPKNPNRILYIRELVRSSQTQKHILVMQNYHNTQGWNRTLLNFCDL
jgi:hypothetical protein